MKRIRIIFCAVMVFLILLSMSRVTLAQPQLISGYYGIDREAGLIGRIPAGTSEAVFLSRVLENGERSLSAGVTTGSVLSLNVNGAKADSLTLVVQADCSCDGKFSVTDMLMVKSFLLNQQKFSPAQNSAADVNGDGSVTITDFLQMKSNVLKLSVFSQGCLEKASVEESLLLVPGDVVPFGPAVEPEEVTEPEDTTDPENASKPEVLIQGDAVTWADGMATAVKVGTARLTWGEETLLITVCEEPQTVSLPKEAILNPKESLQLQPVLNHPVPTEISYTVSDDKVLQVDGTGKLTALAEGTATVTATLPNGASASQSVRVLPFIKSVSLAESAVKVKNGSTRALQFTVQPANATEKLIWTSSDAAIATVDENGVVTGKKNGTVTITCTSQYGKVSASCQVKVCNLIQVALTFDDGPSSAYTGKLLDLLKKYDVDVTFFMVGNRIAGCENLLKRMVAEGHELGYHTWNHSYLYEMSASQISEDYNKFQKAVNDACGGEVTLFRAPGGGITDRALETLPVPHIMWSVDTRDWETRDTYRVRQAILNGLKDGAIILLHDIHGTTLSGTQSALDYIFSKDMDVEFMTVTELLSRDGTPPQAGKTYYYD